jgi:hypothetical protein
MKARDRGFVASMLGADAGEHTANLVDQSAAHPMPTALIEKITHLEHMLPKRVGVPKMIASASESCSTRAIGMWANAARAFFAPLCSSMSSGMSSRT